MRFAELHGRVINSVALDQLIQTIAEVIQARPYTRSLCWQSPPLAAVPRKSACTLISASFHSGSVSQICSAFNRPSRPERTRCNRTFASCVADLIRTSRIFRLVLHPDLDLGFADCGLGCFNRVGTFGTNVPTLQQSKNLRLTQH